MKQAMTPAAEHDEIFFAVRPQLASPHYVVDLQSIAPAAVLAFPAVPLEDFQLQLAVWLADRRRRRDMLLRTTTRTLSRGRLLNPVCRSSPPPSRRFDEHAWVVCQLLRFPDGDPLKLWMLGIEEPVVLVWDYGGGHDEQTVLSLPSEFVTKDS